MAARTPALDLGEALLLDELTAHRRAPWPLRLDEEPGEAFPTLGPVALRLLAAASYTAGALTVAAGIAAAAHHRARR